MFLAAIPAFTFNYVDIIVAVWLIVGIIRGRKRGMTQELLPTLQWIFIVVLAGLFYASFSDIILSSTAGAFTRMWANVTGYLIIGFAIHMMVLGVKHAIGEKLTGSDLFGRAEYYAGMFSGLIRFACIVIALVAIMNARVYTDAELAETERMQKKSFEDIRFPTYGSIQHAVLKESFTGRLMRDNLDRVLIRSVGPTGTRMDTPAQKREDAINAIIGSPKK